MTTMNIKNELNAKQLESINGGGIFDPYRDSTYHQAGVEIVDPGT